MTQRNLSVKVPEVGLLIWGGSIPRTNPTTGPGQSGGGEGSGVIKYIDDGLTVEKVNFENGEVLVGLDGGEIKRKRAVPSENAFRITRAAAEAKGMKVNSLKTSLISVSDATSFKAKAYIRDGMTDMESSGPTSTMKILGFTFGTTPSVKPLVMTIRRKFRQRLWTLYNLKKQGFTQEELVRVYKTYFRPVVDYLDVVHHSLLTDEMDEELDRLQNWAL